MSQATDVAAADVAPPPRFALDGHRTALRRATPASWLFVAGPGFEPINRQALRLRHQTTESAWRLSDSVPREDADLADSLTAPNRA